MLDGAAIVLSRASRGGLAWAAAAVALQGRGAARTMSVAWTADGLALLLSKAIGRKRPCRSRRSLVPCPDSPSFPSKHSATAAAAAVLLADDAPPALLAAAAAAVAASRVRVRVHYVSDVVAGLALGLGVAAVAKGLDRPR